ncbi:MAG: dihydrofolate reductase [Bacteroidia bacterium]|nr:dihydrofolate reductase [Bacteroidia bacterium]
MRKVILSVALSLDGFIEGPNGEYDWCPPPDQKEMDEFLSKIDFIFLGRKSFEMMGSSTFPGKKLFVFSNSLKVRDEKGLQILNGDVDSKVREIKKSGGKDIWLFGGANLTTTFINLGLLDEMWLGLVPVVLGGGKPLFQNIMDRQHFSIVESTPRNGYVSVKYVYKKRRKN